MSYLVYEKGDKVYCLNDHFIASIKRDVLAHEVCSTELFDFAEGQEFHPGDQLRCKKCGALFTKNTGRFVNLNIKNETD